MKLRNTKIYPLNITATVAGQPAEVTRILSVKSSDPSVSPIVTADGKEAFAEAMGIGQGVTITVTAAVMVNGHKQALTGKSELLDIAEDDGMVSVEVQNPDGSVSHQDMPAPAITVGVGQPA